ncbi:hypothetical protein J4E82_011476 [Alternaria postmessia]|uniref:uncharacterized protein n=1 Tax=Alternaria postmessia TaxID=1187938 RepID=UPI002224D89F|nr:uncharacterized protein J4E82_011476 [Alternaria postmessia]KAI5364409.1 hypothetical protein J4E82_011476 [Alternaria postmessia]
MSQFNKEIEDTGSVYALSDDESTPFRRRTGRRKNISMRLVAIVCVLAYLILGTIYVELRVRYGRLEAGIRSARPELFPAMEKSGAFRQDSRVFPLTVAGTPFAGFPSPELDQAWHGLLEGTVIKVSEEDLAYYNVTSLPLADGSGYASEIFMTHELHCLKKIRQWVYKETYFVDVQGLARSELERHVNHCIETLRQSIMCRGDVSLGTYTYLSGDGNDVTARSWASHQCVDFDALMKWTKSRAIDIFAEGVLVKSEDVGSEHITERTKPHE